MDPKRFCSPDLQKLLGPIFDLPGAQTQAGEALRARPPAPPRKLAPVAKSTLERSKPVRRLRGGGQVAVSVGVDLWPGLENDTSDLLGGGGLRRGGPGVSRSARTACRGTAICFSPRSWGAFPPRGGWGCFPLRPRGVAGGGKMDVGQPSTWGFLTAAPLLSHPPPGRAAGGAAGRHGERPEAFCFQQGE